MVMPPTQEMLLPSEFKDHTRVGIIYSELEQNGQKTPSVFTFMYGITH